jgi:hypothetical protein
MKPITTTEFKRHLTDYLHLASSEAVLIMLDDGRLLRLSSIDQEDLEDEVLENDPRFAALIEVRRADYSRYGGISLAQIKEQILTTTRLREDSSEYQINSSGETAADETDHAQKD